MWALQTAERNFRSFTLPHCMAIMRLSHYHLMLKSLAGDACNGNSNTIGAITTLFSCYLKCIEEGRALKAKPNQRCGGEKRKTENVAHLSKPTKIHQPAPFQQVEHCKVLLPLLPKCLDELSKMKAKELYDPSLPEIEGHLNFALAGAHRQCNSEVSKSQHEIG